MSFSDTLSRVLARHDELRNTLAQPGMGREQFAKFSKEYSDLTPVAEAIAELKQIEKEKVDAEAMLADPEMKGEATRELDELKPKIPALEQKIQRLLLPKDEADDRNAILEIRPGAGGDEAGLFAAVLFDMYRKYAVLKGWRFEVLEIAENDHGGLKEGI